MSKWPEDYQKYVLDDIKEYPKNNIPVRASLLERIVRTKLSPKKMHPNPADEFSWESVGPNFNIVGDYVRTIVQNNIPGRPPFSEPIIVEKMKPGGYMLVNGHHRWLACIRAGIPKIWVRIVNLTHEENILIYLAKTKNRKSAAFDLDEVLFTGTNGLPAEAPKRRLSEKTVKDRLRIGAVEVIRALKSQGYDVWVYTAGYDSAKYIRAVFKVYGLEAEGIINGVDRKRYTDTTDLKKKIDEKYKCRLHIDSCSVLCSHTESGEVEQFDLAAEPEKWAGSVLGVLETLKDQL